MPDPTTDNSFEQFPTSPSSSVEQDRQVPHDPERLRLLIPERGIEKLNETTQYIQETMGIDDTEEARVIAGEALVAETEHDLAEPGHTRDEIIVESVAVVEAGINHAPDSTNPILELEHAGPAEKDALTEAIAAMAESETTKLDAEEAVAIIEADPQNRITISTPELEKNKDIKEILEASKGSIRVHTSIDMSADEVARYQEVTGSAEQPAGGFQDFGNVDKNYEKPTYTTGDDKFDKAERISFVKPNDGEDTTVIYRYSSDGYRDGMGRPGNSLSIAFELRDGDASSLRDRLQKDPSSIQDVVGVQLESAGLPDRVGHSIDNAKLEDNVHEFTLEEYEPDGTRKLRTEVSLVPKFESQAETQAERDEIQKAHEYLQHWDIGEDGQLQMGALGKFETRQRSVDILQTQGFDNDPEIKALVEAHIGAKDSENSAIVGSIQQEIDQVIKMRQDAEPGATGNIDKILETLRARQESYSGSIDLVRDPSLTGAVAELLSSREQQTIEEAFKLREQQDMLPWTMPNSKVDENMMAWFKVGYEGIVDHGREPSPDDIFRIAQPMGSNGRDPQDVTLLAKAGVDFSKERNVTRADLQKAGVFFVNRIGDGEQPILGVKIPDPDSEGGVFDVGNRSVLTREEFDKVYRYQQENGYGIGDADPKDVQMDMIAFGMRPEKRARGVEKSIHTGSRINKYGVAYSPFIDSGYRVNSSHGLEGYVGEGATKHWDGRSDKLRMNDIVVHLVNAHPDYPGMSEMFEDAAHDQRYMSAGEYMKLYQPPPDRTELYHALRYGLDTKRERAWVGALDGQEQ